MGRWLARLDFQEPTRIEPTKPTFKRNKLNVGNVGLQLVDIGKKSPQVKKMGRWLGRLKKSEITKSKPIKPLNVGNVGLPVATTRKSKVWHITIKTGARVDRMNMIDPDRMTYEECEKMLINKFGANRLIEFREK